jgi:hypothetical protein
MRYLRLSLTAAPPQGKGTIHAVSVVEFIQGRLFWETNPATDPFCAAPIIQFFALGR